MGDFNIDLLKTHANNVTSKYLVVMTSCFFVSYIQRPTHFASSPATIIDNIFMNSLVFFISSGNLFFQVDDHSSRK